MAATHEAINVETLTDTKLVITRDFAARPAQVFRAFTDPDLVSQWLSSPERPMSLCVIDLKPGGDWRYAWQGGRGQDIAVGGVYREVDEPHRTVHTESFDVDWTDGDTVVTTTFADVNGNTRVTTHIEYPSPESLDAVLTMNMPRDLIAAYRRLDGLLDA